jgi:hypothetical protein
MNESIYFSTVETEEETMKTMNHDIEHDTVLSTSIGVKLFILS